MVLGALAVVRGPLQFTPALEIHLVGFRVQQMLGVQTGLDAFGQVDFLFGVQQVHSADLLQVILDRICGGAGCDHTTLRIAGRRQIVVVIIVTHHESAFFLGLFRLFALVFVIVFQFGIVILVDIVLVEVVLLPFVVHVIKVIVEIIKIGILDGIVFRSVLLDQVLFFFRFLAFLGGGGLLRGVLRDVFVAVFEDSLFLAAGLRVEAFFPEVVFSVRSVCSVFTVVSLVAKLILLLIPPEAYTIWTHFWQGKSSTM